MFAIEGEGGLTPGAAYETKNSAWGLGLSNLVFLVDWNDFGIDPHRAVGRVPGTPADWFRPYGWRVVGTEEGMEWGHRDADGAGVARGDNPEHVPSDGLVPDPQGRGYGQVRRASHGLPTP